MSGLSRLSHLNSDNPFSSHQANRLHLLTHDGLSCQGNKVDTQSLGYEGEGAGDSDVALDHLQLVILQKKHSIRSVIPTVKSKLFYTTAVLFLTLTLPSLLVFCRFCYRMINDARLQ